MHTVHRAYTLCGEGTNRVCVCARINMRNLIRGENLFAKVIAWFHAIAVY